jgi:ribosomal protein S18 acetylase RimI-like enzyme
MMNDRNLNDCIFRPATPEDAPVIAQLTLLAADGLVDFLFDDLVPHCSNQELLCSMIMSETGEVSYRNVEVAVVNDRVVGMAQTYSAEKHRITEEMRAFFPQERLQLLEDFFNSRVEGSLFLDTLAISPPYQGQGIGSQLIARVQQKARNLGYPSVSLIAWTHNQSAIRLYQRQGFQPVKSIQIEPHPRLPHQQGAILFNCVLEG